MSDQTTLTAREAIAQAQTLLKDYSLASSLLAVTGADSASEQKADARRRLLFLLLGDDNTTAWLPAILSMAEEAASHDNLPTPLELASLRRELTAHRDKANGDYWAWQGDGSDHPESLSCPVLIPAADLRTLLAGQQDMRLKKALEELIASRGEPLDETGGAMCTVDPEALDCVQALID